jgi:hypothetical protein
MSDVLLNHPTRAAPGGGFKSERRTVSTELKGMAA